jgi:DNA-binding phage protein
MELSPAQREMITAANHTWASLGIRSVNRLNNWQDMNVLKTEEHDKLEAKLRAGTISPAEENALGNFYLSINPQCVLNLIGDENPHNTQSKLAPIVAFLSSELYRALNPTGNPVFKSTAIQMAADATKQLLRESKNFDPAAGESYRSFALNILRPYLPVAYMDLLSLEAKCIPEPTVTASSITSGTLGVIEQLKTASRKKG